MSQDQRKTDTKERTVKSNENISHEKEKQKK